MMDKDRQLAWLKSHKRNKGRFEVRSEHTDDVAEILIYDVIGFDFWTGGGITAQNFVKELNEINSEKIRVRINSEGGDAFDGLAIFNALRRHEADIEVHIDGLAASAAATIAMAGDEIFIAENAFLMIHRSWALAIGNSEDMIEMAELLSKLDESVAGDLAGKSGKKVSEVLQLMSAETWMNALEALSEGFVDRITESREIESSLDLSLFSNVPDDLKNIGSTRDAGSLPTKRELEESMQDAGLSRSQARKLLRDYGTQDAVEDTSKLVRALRSMTETNNLKISRREIQ